MKMTHVGFAVLAAALTFTACKQQGTTAGGAKDASTETPAAQTAGEPADSTVVATFGDGQKITYGELKDRLNDQLENLDKQRYQLLKRGLEGMVVEKLVQSQAKKAGITEDQWVKQKVDDQVPTPPEDEIKKIYEESKARLPPGTTYEQVKPQIVDFMTGQQKQQKAQELFDSLKKEANAQTMLPPPATKPAKRVQVDAKGPSKGPDTAPVTIVEFSDFQCPFCSRAKGTVDEVMKKYDGKVKLVFRNYPLPFHKQAQKAAEAGACAADQGKFWELHDLMFDNQQKLEVPELKGYAKQAGLDTAKFDKCLDSGEKAGLVASDMADGTKAGVNGTPAFFINGVFLNGAVPLDDFSQTIDAELAAKK